MARAVAEQGGKASRLGGDQTTETPKLSAQLQQRSSPAESHSLSGILDIRERATVLELACAEWNRGTARVKYRERTCSSGCPRINLKTKGRKGTCLSVKGFDAT